MNEHSLARRGRGRHEEARTIVRFGPFEANLASETLYRRGARVRMQQQPFQVLVSLLEHAGEIVTREELCRRLWPASDRAGRDRSLNTALRKVRAALRDSPDHPRYVETVRGRGYRFLAPATVTAQRRAVPGEPRLPQVRRAVTFVALIGAVLVAAVVAAFVVVGLFRG